MDHTTDTDPPQSPQAYLRAAFPPDLLLPDERPVVAYPDSFVSRESGRTVEYYRQFHPRGRLPAGQQALYVCVSTVERQRRRQVKKRLEDVRTAFILALDDIGTKAVAPDVQPTAVLETSAGNYQWHYFIEPYDVSGPDGQAYFDACLYSLAEAGHSDPGMRSASRLARVPGSLHRSGHVCRLVEWSPGRSWDLERLMAEFGVPMVEPKKRQSLAPGKHTRLESVDDPVYLWLLDTGRVLGANDQWVFVECPWRERHTDGAQGSSSTAYSPRDYGREGVGFKCLHGHCAERGVDDFLSWAYREING